MVVANSTDYQALNASRLITRHTNNAASSMAKLASNVRINTAADDPGGIVTAGLLKGRASGSDQAAQNAQNASTVAKAADTAYGNALDILYRMREIATQSVDPTLTAEGKAGLQEEVNVLNSRIGDIAKQSFGNIALFDNAYSFQLGVDAKQAATMTFAAPSSVTMTLGNTSAISAVDTAIKTLTSNQAKAGGNASALGYIADGLNNDSTAMWTAYEGFVGTNVATEMSRYAKNTIMTQQAQLISAQYNQNAYSVLNLLR
jgi:flagellin